jgi:hypothetical protein
VPFDGLWHVVVEKGHWNAPLEVHAATRLMHPNGLVRSSIPADAPPEVRLTAHDMDADEAARLAAEMSLAARSEG